MKNAIYMSPTTHVIQPVLIDIFFGEMTATPKKLSLCSNDVEEDANTADELRSMWNCDTYQFGETFSRYRITHLSDIELAYKLLLTV